MGVFGKLAAAQPTGAANYINPGTYLHRVVCNRLGESQQGKGAFVAIELDTLAVYVPYDAHVWDGDGVTKIPASNKVGERVSSINMLDKAPTMGNLKAYLLAASGLDEAQIVTAYATRNGLELPAALSDVKVIQKAWDDFATRMFEGEGVALAGGLILTRATTIRKRDGKPFTKLTFEHVKPGSDPGAQFGMPGLVPAPAGE